VCSSSDSWLGTITFDQTMPITNTALSTRPKKPDRSSVGQEYQVRVDDLLLALSLRS